VRYLSLFSGIGGFELGIQQAYESNNEYAPVSEKPEQEERSQGRKRSVDKHKIQLHDRDGSAPLCVGYSEINKYATQIYSKHFPEHTNFGDITSIVTSELPDFDLLVGGFPCQSFSIAGKRRGFNDTRGTLFFEIARILRDKRPRYFLLENVKGLLSSDGGKTFQTILGVLTDLGYDLQWQVLNSKNFGVPQNRERVFIIGHLRGEPRPQVFPIGESDSGDIQTQGEPQSKGKRVRSNDTSSTVNTRFGSTARGQQFIANRQPLKFLNRNQRNIEGDYAFTVDSMNTGGVRVDMKIRRLTPTECARLQGFPDDWCADLSDTQAYKCYGNAVTTNVIKAVVERLFYKE